MSWLSDLVSGSQDAERSGTSAPPPERARQLLEGVASTARAGADELGELATRADEAARRLAEGVSAAAGEEQREALERLDRLHFALLRVVVRAEEPGEAAVEAAVEDAEELADRLGGAAAGDGGG